MAFSQLVFLDLETTGLDPREDHILEMGLILVDGVTLKAQARAAWQIRQVRHGDVISSKLCKMDPVVLDMHTQSGLLDACDGPLSSSLCSAEKELLEWFPEGKLMLAGFSPQFDRAFIEAHMPTLYARLHYRMVDVSTFRECLHTWGVIPKGKAVSQHRALPDCEEALEELRIYKHMILEGEV